MKYFTDCKTVEEAKSLYKDLVKKYHPDIAGAEFTEKMQEINAEFEKAFEYLKHHHSDDTQTAYNRDNVAETPQEFMNIINSLIHCDGLKIELVGRWIWLTGNTYAHREIIKSLAFRWSNSKKAWYWRKAEDAGKNRAHNMTLDEIKDKYGCQVFSTVSMPRFAH